MTQAHTQRIRFDASRGLRATGVDVYTPDGERTFEARRGVILAAGAIASPQLLQVSGVGDPDWLAQIGVPVQHALTGVGRNLQDHLQVRSIYRVRNTTTLNSRAGNLFGKARMALEYALFRTGPLTMPPSQLGAFAYSDDNQPSANIEWHVQPLSLDRFGEPLHDFDAITPSVCNLRPSSRGTLRATSPHMHDAPAIAVNYLATEDDQRVAVEGLRFTRRIMAAKPLERFAPEEWKPGAHLQSDAELLEAAQALGTTIFHPVGTCKMGSDAQAVVSDRLAVHGIGNLWVADASVMPTITSGNTNAPTAMIAEKGAAMILEDSR